MSHHPSQAGSQGHSQRVSVHDRIGPNPMQNQDNRDNRGNRGTQGGRDGDARGRPLVHPAPYNPPR
jgi:hypothetical protein